MAVSPSHALGQIAGYMMEQAFFDMILPVANEFDLFVDRQGPRPARGTRKKVTWVDDHDNKHDLDCAGARRLVKHARKTGSFHRERVATIHEALCQQGR
ncbi:hypothetical protein [Sediminivirga luteola]|jgi:hypothetical protein|uniref:hypothetical protein n=1 Tax=Sediminivirga luteola TaxID=1774748 RepID=UPI001F57D8AD|nr:hypothetical protein [Sediminivirga luteola]MCI2265766.1 hypothetical protein [Sediminivirga luteola]